jgi:hypothetical protein
MLGSAARGADPRRERPTSGTYELLRSVPLLSVLDRAELERLAVEAMGIG